MVKAFDTLWNKLPDADDLFAYDTVKEVRVLDRRLGLIYYLVLGLVVFYVTVIVFLINKKYQDYEKSDGWVLAKIHNSPFAADNTVPFDIYDAVHNPGEAGALFLPTRVLITRGQKNTSIWFFGFWFFFGGE